MRDEISFWIINSLFFLITLALFIRIFELTIVKGNYYYELAKKNKVREVVIEAERGTIYDRKGVPLAKNSAPIHEEDGRVVSKRTYYFPLSFSHLIGYRLQASKEDINNDKCFPKLKLGDKLGKAGIEKLFDCTLRGKDGKKLIETNSKGKEKRVLSIIKPTSGKDIYLSADSLLQQKAYELIKDKKAALIALSPRTGEILSLVSSPAFSSQMFEDKDKETILSYQKDKDKPLFNRATQGVYPAGSTFKLVVAAAGLEEKVVDEKTLFQDTGTLRAGPLTFGNWYYLEYGKKEGAINIVTAIKRSNDIFFYKLGALLTPQKIDKYAYLFGFGQRTNLGLPEESGQVPSPFWKEETMKSRWFLGDTYNLSIGQGYLLVTPLQIARMTSAIASGRLCQPHLLKNQRSNCKTLPLSSKTLTLIRTGMKEACEQGGTGWPFFHFKVKDGSKSKRLYVSCKTGTAQSHSNSLPHAWFTLFAPSENPQIVVTVLVENGGEGSYVAAPIAKEFLKTYFERSK